MGNLLSYSGIVTKIRAMQANLISSEDYQTIANLESTAEFFAFLKNHPGYREIFYNYDEHILHRGQAEKVFINSLYQDFYKIYEFADLEQRNDLNFIFFRYEVDVLKSCLQMIYTKVKDYNSDILASFFNRRSGIDIKTLASSQSMEEYINYLRDTEYYSLLNSISNAPNATPFDYQMQLDIYYFKKTWQLKDKLLNGDNRLAFTHRLGTEIDLLNIMWLYRSKKYFNVRSADSYAYVIPITYKLTKEKLMLLMESVSMEEFIAVIKTTYYEHLIPSLADGSIEIACQKMLAKVYKDNTSMYPASMSPVNYYLYLKQMELRRLITALECIRYKLGPQDTLKYVLA